MYRKEWKYIVTNVITKNIDGDIRFIGVNIQDKWIEQSIFNWFSEAERENFTNNPNDILNKEIYIGYLNEVNGQLHLSRFVWFV